MPIVQLADVIQPEFFSQYLSENSMTSTALFRSGVLVTNPLMKAELSAGGNTLNIPLWAICFRPLIPVALIRI
jgi:hypothetical protein